MRRSAIAMTTALALLLLVGCDAQAPESAGETQRSPEASASRSTTAPAAQSKVQPPTFADGDELARGTMVDAAGGQIADVVVRWRGQSEVAVTVPLAQEFTPEHQLMASPRPLEIGDCFDVGMRLALGSAGGHEFVTGSSFGDGDLSFLDAIVIVRSPAIDEIDDWVAQRCLARVVAVAPLTWSTPDMRPDLVVKDSGTTSGATGSTELADGAVISYTVARNDVMSAIAARFGITTVDIRYLNPTRASVCGSQLTACAEETLNLSKAHR